MKLKEIRDWYVKNNKIYFASIELTQNCNFKCKHCYCANKQAKNLSFDAYIDIINKLYDIGCLFLNFTGGEIFTNKDFKKIYLYAKDKGFIIDLLTNASLIDGELIELFKKYPPNNIAVTLYGTNSNDYEKFTGSKENFFQVFHALDQLQINNIPFVLRTVATRTLIRSLMNGDFEKIAGERFNTSFKYDPIVFPKTNGDTTNLIECLDISQIIELEKNTLLRREAWENEVCKSKNFEWSCKAGLNSMAIDFEGNAFVCGLFRTEPISLLKNDINVVIKHLNEIHSRHVKIMKTNECSTCSYRSICKCCPAYSYLYNNNEYDKVDFFCKLANARVCAFGKK